MNMYATDNLFIREQNSINDIKDDSIIGSEEILGDPIVPGGEEPIVPKEFHFNIGSETIIIENTLANKAAKLVFGEGITAENLTMEQISFDNTVNKDIKITINVDNITSQLYLNDVIARQGTLTPVMAENVDQYEIQFADGIKWAMSDLFNNATHVIYGAHGKDDTVTGYSDYRNIIYAGPGNDLIMGGELDDVIYAGDDDDIVHSGAGNDILYGGAGDDQLYGDSGNDRLDGGLGNDTYFCGASEGISVINNFAKDHASTQDVLVLEDDVVISSDLVFSIESLRGKNEYDLKISFKNLPDDAIYLENAFAGSYLQNKHMSDNATLHAIKFADGTELSTEQIYGSVIAGSDAVDTLTGTEVNNTIYGLGGNDTLSGGAGNDFIFSGAGDDVIEGDDGDDHLYGGRGMDKLTGGAGNDIYYFNSGDGLDTINNYNSHKDDLDKLFFGKDIAISDLFVARVNGVREIDSLGLNLCISFSNNPKDAIMLENIYFNDESLSWDDDRGVNTLAVLDEFKFEKGEVLSMQHFFDAAASNEGKGGTIIMPMSFADTNATNMYSAVINNNLDSLVNSMATFDVPASAASAFTQNPATVLSTLIAVGC